MTLPHREAFSADTDDALTRLTERLEEGFAQATADRRDLRQGLADVVAGQREMRQDHGRHAEVALVQDGVVDQASWEMALARW